MNSNRSYNSNRWVGLFSWSCMWY